MYQHIHLRTFTCRYIFNGLYLTLVWLLTSESMCQHMLGFSLRHPQWHVGHEQNLCKGGSNVITWSQKIARKYDSFCLSHSVTGGNARNEGYDCIIYASHSRMFDLCAYARILTCPILVIFVAVIRFWRVVVSFDEHVLWCSSVQRALFAETHNTRQRDVCVCFWRILILTRTSLSKRRTRSHTSKQTQRTWRMAPMPSRNCSKVQWLWNCQQIWLSQTVFVHSSSHALELLPFVLAVE